MVRPGLLALVVLGACSGEIQSDNLEGLSPAEQVARQKWVDKALPVFATKCALCHDGSMATATGYLAGADDLMKRDTAVNHVPRVVNLGAPRSSKVLTQGAHTGPALDVAEQTAILSWIEAERDARPDMPALRTMQVTAMLCTGGAPGSPTCPLNSIDLTPLGAAGSFEFVLSDVSGASYFTNLKIKAGAEGLYVEHPLLESWPAGAMMPTPEPIDLFFAVLLNLAPNAEQAIGQNGTATVSTFKATDPLSVRFDIVEKQRPMM